MGTETWLLLHNQLYFDSHIVKLNNPLMGTETLLYQNHE